MPKQVDAKNRIFRICLSHYRKLRASVADRQAGKQALVLLAKHSSSTPRAVVMAWTSGPFLVDWGHLCCSFMLLIGVFYVIMYRFRKVLTEFSLPLSTGDHILK